MATLTEDQKRRIELNRRRALELRAKRAQNGAATGVVPPVHKNVSVARSAAGRRDSHTTGFNAYKVPKDSGVFPAAGSETSHSSSTVGGQFLSRPSGTNSCGSASGGTVYNQAPASNAIIKPVHQSSGGQFQSRVDGPSSGLAASLQSNHVSNGRQSKSALEKPSSNWKVSPVMNKPLQFTGRSSSTLECPKNVNQPSTSDSVASTCPNSFSSAKPTSQFYKKTKVAEGTGSDNRSSMTKGQALPSHGFQSLHGGSSVSTKVMQGFGSSSRQMQQSGANFLQQKKTAGSLFGLKPSTLGSCLLISRDRFEVQIPYRQDIIDCFNKVPSKSYARELRKLAAPVEVQPLPSTVVKLFSSPSSDRPIQEANLTSIDEKLRDGLLPFQRDGVSFVIHHGGRAMIADDMGLGKTIQAICVACYYRTEWPLLIVSPSSMRYSWAEAFEKWVPSVSQDDLHVVVTGPNQRYDALVNIISYDLMARRSKDLARQKYQVVIMDESHFLKNYKTARTRAAMPILKNAPRRILLSGTPALSRPAELYMQIQALHLSMFPSFHEFGLRYCDAKQNAWGWDYSGSSNLSELQLVLEKKIMIRRLKSDVLSQLPSKTRQKIILDPKSIKCNSASIKNLASAAKKEKADREMILQYYAATARLKENAVRTYVEDLLEGDKKFLVFAHHQSMLAALCGACEAKKVGYIRIDGSTPPQQRFKYCEDFQTKDEYRVAVLSIMAANAGITLTAASLVVFAELNWNPGILMQAEDRAHRIGQSDAVFIHYLIARGTADDLLWPLVQRKLATLEKAGLSKNDFSEADTKLMKDPKQQSILNFLEQSFCEELSQEELRALDEAEADSGKSDHENTKPAEGTLLDLWSTASKDPTNRPSKRLKTDTRR